MGPLCSDYVHTNVHTGTFLTRARLPGYRPSRIEKCSSQRVPREFVDIVVDIPGEKKSTLVSGQCCQGLRSRGGHVWPPCLEGADCFMDTMDVVGPLGPAWMRLCLSPPQMDQTRLRPQESVDLGCGGVRIGDATV